MLQRIEHPSGVVIYQSPLLRAAGIVHAFSTRLAGVSSGPFESLNLGNPGGIEQQDSPEHIAVNYQLLQMAMGAPGMHRAWVKQVHGRRVEWLEHEPENEYGETLEAEIRDRFSGQLAADALVTGERSEPGVLLTIRVADCAPILLGTEDGAIVAAAHAGWRGVVGNVAGKTVRAIVETGARADAIVAAIGPAISAEYFEVGEEVAAEFVRCDLAAAVHPVPGGKPHVDLQAAIRLQLERAGVRRIDGNDRCTFRDREDFFSHRRDRGITGRMAALIGAARRGQPNRIL